MGAYICIGLAIFIISICVFVAIGSMKTHGEGKFEKMAALLENGLVNQLKILMMVQWKQQKRVEANGLMA